MGDISDVMGAADDDDEIKIPSFADLNREIRILKRERDALRERTAKLESAAADVVACWLPSDRAAHGPTMNGAIDALAALLSDNGASNG